MPNQPTAKLTHEQIRALLPASEKPGRLQCPVCSTGNLTLFGDDGVKCWTGCSTADVTKAIRALMPTAKKVKPSAEDDWQGFTLAEYCELKKLSELGLRSFFSLDWDKEPLEAKFDGKTVVAWPYYNADGKLISTKLRKSADSHDTCFRPKDPHIPYGLWLWTNKADADGNWPQDVFIVEGESDTQTFFAHNLPAIGISGSSGWRTEYAQLPVLKNAERIFIIEEHDEAGKKFAERITQDLPAEKTFKLRLSMKDPSELHIEAMLGKEFGGMSFTELLDSTLQQASSVSALREAEDWGLEIISASDLEPKVYEWMWEDRIPLNTLTLFFGLPGQGKSTVTVDLAARMTTGREWPDRPNAISPSDVLMLIAEDELDDTVIPRLMAAKADLKRIKFVKTKSRLKDATKEEKRIALDEDMLTVERTLARMPSIRLVIIDPVSSYLGEINPNKSGEIRPLLEGLKDLARRVGVTVIGVAHFNKNAEQETIHRISGAGAWGEVPRSLWGFVPKPAEEGQQVDSENPSSLMLNAKLNTASAARRQGLTYKFEDVTLPIGEKTTRTSRINWLGGTTATLTDVMAKQKSKPGRAPVATDAAMDWLMNYLADGPRDSVDVFADGLAAGHSKKTIYEAKDRLGFSATRKPDGTWQWLSVRKEKSDEEAGAHGEVY